ncbi:MAG: hypothetical protein CMH59_25590, partial [Myxococcales bacterium]|nr:hypothetical protein [Myxococcales bacterium]
GGPEGEAARAGGGEPGAPPAASPGSAPTDEAPSPAAALQIDIHPCVGVVPATVRRVTRIELDSDLELAELTPRDVTRVWVECARDDTIALRVDDPTTGKTVTRRVDLSTTAAMARSRLLALAIAELVSASWIEHRMRRETAVRAVDATAAAPIRRFAGALAGRRLELPAAPTAPGPDRPSRRAKGLLYGLVGAAGRPAHLVGGGAFRVFVDLGERALLATAFEVARGEASAEGRDVLLHRVSLSTTFAFRERFGDLMLAGGVGARVGRALLRGRGAGGTTHVGAFGGAFLAGDALWRWGRLVLGARLEVGTITLPVNGTRAGRALAGLDGGWGTLQLGAGLVL